MANLHGELFVDEIELKLTEPEFNGSNLTNHVLIWQKSEERTMYRSHKAQKKTQNRVNYYLPAYLWIKIKNFTNLNLEDLQAQINIEMNIVINMKDIPQILKDHVRNKLVLGFNKDDALNLGDDTLLGISKKVIEKDIQQFTVRKILKSEIHAFVQFAPLEQLNLIVSVSIQQIQITKQKLNKIVKQSQEQIKQKTKKLQSAQHNLKDKKRSINRDSQTLEKAKRNQQENQYIQKLQKSIEIQQQDIQRQQKYIQTQLQDIERLQEQIKYIDKCRTIKFDFNLMDVDEKHFTKISYTQQGSFGYYDLAEGILNVIYSNQDTYIKDYTIGQQDEQDQTKNYAEVQDFSYGHFIIPLYRYPQVGIITIFIPLWLLGIINLGIFFQDTGLGDRINSMAGLMIAFVAFIPVIRKQLPPSPDITLVQLSVYGLTLTTIFCFIQSLQVRGDQEYEFDWSTNGLFIASIAIMIYQVLVVIGLIIFYCMKLKHYNKQKQYDSSSIFKVGTFKKWSNQECDQHFRRKIDSRQIEVLKIKKQKQQKNRKNQKKQK